MRIVLAGLLASVALPVFAQDAARGHWTGSVETPGRATNMELDLDKAASGWIGSLSIPAQNSSGIPLEAITFADGKCSFRIKGVPGEPTFNGSIAADGKTMSGELSQGPGVFPFKFTRAGEPKVEVEKNSPALDKPFLGTWEGTLEAGQPLRLVLKMSNSDAGGKAVLTSLDQGGAEIPVSTIDQKGARITLQVKLIGGRFEGEIDKTGSELNGTWTQGGHDIALQFKKAAAPAKKP